MSLRVYPLVKGYWAAASTQRFHHRFDEIDASQGGVNFAVPIVPAESGFHKAAPVNWGSFLWVSL